MVNLDILIIRYPQFGAWQFISKLLSITIGTIAVLKLSIATGINFMYVFFITKPKKTT